MPPVSRRHSVMRGITGGRQVSPTKENDESEPQNEGDDRNAKRIENERAILIGRVAVQNACEGAERG